MATLTFSPAVGANYPVDGSGGRSIYPSSETFTTLRNGAGTGASSTGSGVVVSLTSSTTANKYEALFRALFCFDTSSLGSGALITSATLTLHGLTKVNGLGSPALHICSANPASTSSLSNADFSGSKFGNVSYGSISYASFNASGPNTINLNASGMTNISKTGTSIFGARLSWDLNNSFTGTWANSYSTQLGFWMADHDPSTLPLLTVTYDYQSSISGTLLLSGTINPKKKIASSLAGVLLLSGHANPQRQLDTSVIEKKVFMYKVYDEDNNFVGIWDDVIDEPNWSQELNTTGSAQTVYLARNSDSLVISTEVLQDNSGATIEDNNDFDILTSVGSRNKVGPGSNVNHNYRVDIFAFYGSEEAITDNLDIPIEDNEGNSLTSTVGAPNGIRRFTGFISEINVNYGDTENTQVQLMSYGYDLDQYPVVTPGGNTTVAFNSYEPGDIVKDGLDQFTTSAAGNSFTTYSSATVEDTGTTVSYTFRLNTYKELLETAIKLAPAGWFFYVGLGDNLVRFRPKPTVPRHTFYLGKHIKNLNLRSYIGDVVNDVIFTGGGDPALFKRYTETPVAGTRRGLDRPSDNRVTLEASADILSEGEIDEKKAIQYRSTVDILDKTYDIESIELGDLVAFRNFDNQVDLLTMQIVALNYTPDIITLQLDTLPPTIPKRLEELRKSLNAQENLLVPIAPDS